MAEYTKQFVNPYPDGWKDLPDDSTPITAAALQQHTNAIESVEQYLEDNPIGSGSAQIDYGTNDEFEQKKDDLPIGASFYVTDDNDEAFNSNIYSLDEVRIGTFLDKPLYRRMFPTNKTSISTSTFNVDVGYESNQMNALVNATLLKFKRDAEVHVVTGLGAWHTPAYGNQVSIKSFQASDSYAGDYIYLVLDYTKVGD